MKQLMNSNEKTAAVAGCLFVKNAKKSFITKLQEWDYTLGIFGVKLVQGNYNSTLVAQGAFSAYKTKLLKEIGGWKNCVGEDIVLTWQLLAKGYETNFCQKCNCIYRSSRKTKRPRKTKKKMGKRDDRSI